MIEVDPNLPVSLRSLRDNHVLYLATPYSNHDLHLKYEEACEQSAFLMGLGLNVLSPIAMHHGVSFAAERMDKPLPSDHDYWLQQIDEPLLNRCDGIIFCKLPGWESSKGMHFEFVRSFQVGMRSWSMNPFCLPGPSTISTDHFTNPYDFK